MMIGLELKTIGIRSVRSAGVQKYIQKCTKWPRDLDFDRAWPICEPDLDIMEIQLLTKFDDDRMKTIGIRERTRCWCTEMHIQKCTMWPRDLDFDWAWPICELDLDIMKIQPLTKFDDDRMKTIGIRERTRQKRAYTNALSDPVTLILTEHDPYANLT